MSARSFVSTDVGDGSRGESSHSEQSSPQFLRLPTLIVVDEEFACGPRPDQCTAARSNGYCAVNLRFANAREEGIRTINPAIATTTTMTTTFGSLKLWPAAAIQLQVVRPARALSPGRRHKGASRRSWRRARARRAEHRAAAQGSERGCDLHPSPACSKPRSTARRPSRAHADAPGGGTALRAIGQAGDRRYNVHDLDKWLDSIKNCDGDADAIVARFGNHDIRAS
jgi:hypothetical protein